MSTCQEEDDRLVIAFNSLCKCFGAFHYCQHLTFLEEESDNILTATTPRIRIPFSENSLSGCVNEFFDYPTNKSLFFNFRVFVNSYIHRIHREDVASRTGLTEARVQVYTVY